MDGKSSWLLKTVTSIDLTEFTDNLLPLELLTLAFVTKTTLNVERCSVFIPHFRLFKAAPNG